MSDSSDSDDDYYGPALPPSVKKPDDNSKRAVIGPSIPAHILKKDTSNVDIQKGQGQSRQQPQGIGPVLPASLQHLLKANESDNDEVIPEDRLQDYDEDDESEDSDSVIGPLPPDHPKALERACSSRPATTVADDNKKLKREEWMLIPPKNKPVSELGLAPRKFLARTPAEPRKCDDSDEEEDFDTIARAAIDQKITDEYDSQMDKLKDAAGKKRSSESLLDTHRKNLKKKKKEEEQDRKGKPVERRPFDRDVDLHISGMSSKDKEKYIQKSHELNSRFKGGNRKYL